GVQTCALPIFPRHELRTKREGRSEWSATRAVIRRATFKKAAARLPRRRSRAQARLKLERETGFEPVAAEFKTGRLYSGSAHRRARTAIQMHPRWGQRWGQPLDLTRRLQESSATRQASTISSGELAMFDQDPTVQEVVDNKA